MKITYIYDDGNLGANSDSFLENVYHSTLSEAKEQVVGDLKDHLVFVTSTPIYDDSTRLEEYRETLDDIERVIGADTVDEFQKAVLTLGYKVLDQGEGSNKEDFILYQNDNGEVKVGTLNDLKLELISDLAGYISYNQNFESEVKTSIENVKLLSQEIIYITEVSYLTDMEEYLDAYGYRAWLNFKPSNIKNVPLEQVKLNATVFVEGELTKKMQDVPSHGLALGSTIDIQFYEVSREEVQLSATGLNPGGSLLIVVVALSVGVEDNNVVVKVLDRK